MPFTVPNAVNYAAPLNAVPFDWSKTPIEGAKVVECEVDWGTMGGPNNCVNFNLQNNATLAFSQIRALAVDNSQCGSDIRFSFPDTQTTITIPAYAPYTLVPVISNATSFWLQALGEEPEDVTRFTIMNSCPPPLAVPVSEEQNAASVASSGIASGSGSLQIVPTGINGTLENIYATCALYDAFNIGGNATFVIEDGTGKIVAQSAVAVNEQSQTNVIFLNSDGLRVRFQNGLVCNWTAAQVSSGNLNINAYYRTP